MPVTLVTPSARDPLPGGCPLVCAAEHGFAPLSMEVDDRRGWPTELVTQVNDLADAVRYSEAGPLVALVRAPGGRRPLVLIQSNRGPWYASRHRSDTERVWTEFYRATVAAGLLAAFRRWGASDIVLQHPTGNDWPPGLADAVGGALVDAAQSGLGRVWLGECCGRRGLVGEIRRALRQAPGPLPTWSEVPFHGAGHPRGSVVLKLDGDWEPPSTTSRA